MLVVFVGAGVGVGVGGGGGSDAFFYCVGVCPATSTNATNYGASCLTARSCTNNLPPDSRRKHGENRPRPNHGERERNPCPHKRGRTPTRATHQSNSPMMLATFPVGHSMAAVFPRGTARTGCRRNKPGPPRCSRRRRYPQSSHHLNHKNRTCQRTACNS